MISAPAPFKLRKTLVTIAVNLQLKLMILWTLATRTPRVHNLRLKPPSNIFSHLPTVCYSILKYPIILAFHLEQMLGPISQIPKKLLDAITIWTAPFRLIILLAISQMHKITLTSIHQDQRI